MKLDKIQLGIDSHIENATAIKDMVLDRLVKDKMLTKRQADEYAIKWQIILVKRAWYKRLFKGDEDPEGYSFKFVKLAE